MKKIPACQRYKMDKWGKFTCGRTEGKSFTEYLQY